MPVIAAEMLALASLAIPPPTPTPIATPTPFQIVVEGGGGGPGSGWALLIAVLAAASGYFGAILTRRTGRDTNQLTAESIANAVESRLDTRLTALELDKWRRREETMRLLRWAAEQATSAEGAQDSWRVGLATLGALGDSELLQEEDQALIDAVLKALYADPESEYAEAAAEGDEPQVVLGDEEADA